LAGGDGGKGGKAGLVRIICPEAVRDKIGFKIVTQGGEGGTTGKGGDGGAGGLGRLNPYEKYKPITFGYEIDKARSNVKAANGSVGPLGQDGKPGARGEPATQAILGNTVEDVFKYLPVHDEDLRKWIKEDKSKSTTKNTLAFAVGIGATFTDIVEPTFAFLRQIAVARGLELEAELTAPLP
jgi:hypothetical protein